MEHSNEECNRSDGTTVDPEKHGAQQVHQEGGVVYPNGEVKLNSVFSLNKVQIVFSSFAGEKRDLVNSIGFGGLMSMHKQPKISRRLGCWLLSNFDVVTSTIKLCRGVKIKVVDYDVHLVLGLPGDEDALIGPQLSVSHAHDVVKAILRLGKNSEITLDYVESLLTKDYGGRMSSEEKDAFKVAAVIFADAHFLAPRTAAYKVNQSIMPYLVDPSCIQNVNWCHHVLSAVKQASMRVKQGLAAGKKSIPLDCCLIFLEVTIQPTVVNVFTTVAF